MSDNKYLRRIEHAIYNWNLQEDNPNPIPVLNALKEAMDNDETIFVPIESPGDLTKYLQGLSVGDTFTTQEEVGLSFIHIEVEDDKYYIPLFTSQEELDKFRPVSSINLPLKDLFSSIKNWDKCVGYALNPMTSPFFIPSSFALTLEEYKPISQICLINKGVLDVHTEAIVNAANSSLLGGGGVDGAIHKASGPKLLEECKKLGGCETGEAKITRAYDIDFADYIIHTVGPIYDNKEEDSINLARCYLNSLDLTKQYGVTSVGFPCISTGAYGYPLEEACVIALKAITHWLDTNQDYIMNVYLCCFKEEEYDAYYDIFVEPFTQKE